jgi:hypothetical protein
MEQKWSVGDVFSIELSDGTFMFGQIIGTRSRCPTCAAFEVRKTMAEITLPELKESVVISVRNTTGGYFDNGKFSVLFKTNPIIDASGVCHDGWIGDGIFVGFCEAYYGLAPWSFMGKKSNYDEMLQTGVTKPEMSFDGNINDSIISDLLYLKKYPKMFICGEINYSVMETFLNGFLVALSRYSDTSLDRKMSFWFRDKGNHSSSLAFTEQVKQYYKDSPEEERITIFIDTILKFFKENPNWYS